VKYDKFRKALSELGDNMKTCERDIYYSLRPILLVAGLVQSSTKSATSNMGQRVYCFILHRLSATLPVLLLCKGLSSLSM
jgi:hypothetical protein